MLFTHIYYYNDSIYYLQAKGSRNKLEYELCMHGITKRRIRNEKKHHFHIS